MMKLITKFLQKIQNEGILPATKNLFKWLRSNTIGLQKNVKKRKIFLSKKINKKLKSTVAYGPFKGLKFAENSWWGLSDRAGMLLGLYEQEILKSLEDIPKKYKIFIDLGAADGYYGVGVIVSGMFEKSYCYEISPEGRKVIKENAKINNVDDRVIIRAAADKKFYKELPSEEISQSILFVDIEGAEFNLFDKETFEKFKESIIYIEIHDWYFCDGEERLNKLKNDAEELFKITKITTTSRDLSVFKELKEMNDIDRWLICSEGRGKLMEWWKLEPKKG